MIPRIGRHRSRSIVMIVRLIVYDDYARRMSKRITDVRSVLTVMSRIEIEPNAVFTASYLLWGISGNIESK